MPDSGTAIGDVDEGGTETGGGTGPRAIGASLVVVYRDPTMPFKSVVIYDGGAKKTAFATMDQTIAGFYQASANPVAKMTHIVGDGRSGVSERVLFAGQLIATNPFVGEEGPKWDNPTFSNLPLAAGAASAAVRVAPNGLLSDCLCYSGIVLSTGVADADGDGLLDVWESSTTTLSDPNGQPLPNLAAMGADKDVKDLFIEIGYMETLAPATYGGVSKAAHSHLPTPAALKLVGDAFANAPSGSIRVHFDVGEDYPAGEADSYIIRGPGLARGGDAIAETITQCTRLPGDPPWVCQFSDYPGTIGWKSGFRFLRDQVFSVTPTPPVTNPPTPLEDYCGVPGYTCGVRFDRNRKDMFRYALFAHALGLPKSEEPTDPGFHVPRTNTGVGDFPGGDVMVTLGAFSDTDGLPVGTPFMQASTLMHELGHNMERRHGGGASEPNCKPTYLSVMNYLYQLRGLLDDAGKPHLDFSGTTSGGISEASLSDGPWGGFRYRIGWYAPLAGSYLAGKGTAALRRCDGSDYLPSEPPMVRIDARTAAGTIDWNADGVTADSAFSLDINFNGRIDDSLSDANDWSNILLNQTGARRNTGGVYADFEGYLFVGPLSLDSGRGDLGRGDLGRGDLGRGDLGRGDLGRGDLGRGDLGRGDLGRGDLGRGDLGRGDLGRGDLGGGDLFVGDPDNPGGELDFETATDLARTPPNEFTATSSASGVLASWKAPNIGGVTGYGVYRVPGNALLPGQTWQPAAGTITEVVPGTYTLVDDAALYGTDYIYFAVATYGDGIQSDPSNLVPITTPRGSSTVTITCPASVSYTGSALTPCTVAVTGPGGLSLTPDPIYASNINAGTASASYTFEGDTSYFGSTGSANFTIVQAISTVVISCPASVVYSGMAQTPCTAEATGVGIAPVDVTPALVYGNNTHTGAATVNVSWGGDANNSASSGSSSFTIAQASPTVTVSCTASVTYDGTARTPCTAQATGVGIDPVDVTASIVYGSNTNAGAATASASWGGDANHTQNSGTGGFTIDKAPSTVAVACTPSLVYTGFPQVPCAAQATGVAMSPVNVSASLVYAGNTNAGAASATATYDGDANHFGSTGVGGFTIAKATPVFSALSGPTIDAGTTPTVLAGTLRSGALVPSGNVSITLNGVTQSPAISATGTFSASFATGALTTTGSPYTITYSYLGDANFNAAVPDTSKGLTVNVVYTLVGIKNVPPPTGTKFNAGSAVTMEWQFRQGSTAVDSSQVVHKVIVAGGGMSLSFLNTDPGGSGFRYSSSSKTWQFNLQTKSASGQKFPAGTYTVTIAPQAAGYASRTFQIVPEVAKPIPSLPVGPNTARPAFRPGTFQRSVTCAFSGVSGERVLRGLPANGEVRAVRLCGLGAIQPFLDAALIVIDRREVAVRGLLVEEQRQSLAAALEGAVELGIGLRERAAFQIGPPEIEVADPRVQQIVGVCEVFDRPARVAVLERGQSVDDQGIRLRLGLELGAERGRDRAGSRGCTRFDEDPCRQEPDLHGLADRQRPLGSGEGGGMLPPQELRVGERGELAGGPVGILGRQVCGGALREDLRGVQEPALVQREIGEARSRVGCPLFVDLGQTLECRGSLA